MASASLTWYGARGQVRVNYDETVSGDYSLITVTSVQVLSTQNTGWPFYADGVIKVNGQTVLEMDQTNKYYAYISYGWTFYDIKNQSSGEIVTGGTVAVPHKSDGSGSTQIYIGPRSSTGYRDFNVFCIGAPGGNIEISASNQNITLENIPKPSSVSTSATGTLGSAINIAISRASASFTHTLGYAFSSDIGTDIGNEAKWMGTIVNKGTATAYTWTPPQNLATKFPNTTSGGFTIICKTYNGSTLVGTKSTTITLSTTAVPTIKSVTLSPENANDTIKGWNLYVKGYTRLNVAIVAEALYGASIKEYSVLLNSTLIGSTATFTSDVLSVSGDKIPVSVTVKDSRGRSSVAYTSQISVEDYSPPQINSVAIFRCNAQGEADSNGTYISLKGSPSISSMNAKNSYNMAYRYKLATADSYGANTAYNNEKEDDPSPVVFGNGSIDISHSYSIQLLIGDAINPLSASPTIIQVTIPSQMFTLHCMNGGLGVAVGKASEYNNCFEVADNWDVRIGAGKLMVGGKKFQLVFHNVSTGAFSSNSTYSSFPYRAAVALTGVDQSMIPEVVLGVTEATSGSYAPVAETYNGGVYIYSNSTQSITIPTIICWGGGA